MFIQPHHFQQGFLCLEEQLGALVSDYVPHYTGVSVLSIWEGDCENFNFKINQVECRFPGGTLVRYPGNATVASRKFKEFLDANRGRIEVFLALPSLIEENANCLRFDEQGLGGKKYRYTSRMEKVGDIVAGGNVREIEVKELNPKILFTGEKTFGYETVRIAAIERAAKAGAQGSVATLDKDDIPPCIDVQGSPRLQHIMREIANRLISKNRTLRKYWKSKDTAAAMKTRDTFKVQTLAVATNAFTQLATVKKLHPFTLYGKIAETIGMLSIYCENDEYVEVPAYDHENLTACFARVHTNMIKLLSLLEDVSFESRVFAIGDDMLVCTLDEAWFDERYELFICFESQAGEAEVEQKVSGLKTAPDKLIPILNQRRIRGMQLDGPLHHIPSLPTSPHHHYYKLPRDTTYFPKLRETPTLGIWGPTQFAELVTFYAVERK